ncbi:PIN domain-containing protein [soil metagenome]
MFVDTSAFYAVFDADDEEHGRAGDVWSSLLGESTLTTSNYVLLETLALLQNRLGVESVRAFEDAVTPLLRVLWIDETVHRQAVVALLTAGRRALSLVDCTSFVLMRTHGLESAFAFDQHFDEQGFRVLPNADEGPERL